MPGPPNWFIALPFPPAALPPGTLRERPEGARLVERDDLHVTVAFLGAVGENRALAAWAELADCDEAAPTAALGPRACFGNPRRPSAFGLELDPGGSGTLARFIAAWRDPLRAATGLAPERRGVRPHVTLGRPPRRAGRSWDRRLSAWLQVPTPAASVTFEQIALYTRAEAHSQRRFQTPRRYRWTPEGPIEEKTA